MAHTLTTAPFAANFSDDSFQRYYEEAGPDYAAWSPQFNMHFGFFRRGMNPFDREAMLEQMNLEISRRLQLTGIPSPRILDMGCGLGATLRSLARRLPSADLHGLTLVPWQLEEGRRLNASASHSANIRLCLADYEHTSFATESFDAIYAIESSCYGDGANKARFSIMQLTQGCHSAIVVYVTSSFQHRFPPVLHELSRPELFSDERDAVAPLRPSSPSDAFSVSYAA